GGTGRRGGVTAAWVIRVGAGGQGRTRQPPIDRVTVHSAPRVLTAQRKTDGQHAGADERRVERVECGVETLVPLPDGRAEARSYEALRVPCESQAASCWMAELKFGPTSAR